ncbi:hypothetical protein D0X99_15610 [Algoriphagus lacus]|uniref:Uncharacterized protein n=2 Tax=Algoriphagus lacus TaxID=2056311 RepID=A0A418PPA5_9BACT|nr:hypothetical protein D0X99_15610 [Algoriphagus lacus]
MKKGKVKASVTFAISNEFEAVSLPKSPFGGFWIEENLTSSSLEAFLKAVILELKQRRIAFIRVIQPPKVYEPKTDLINYLLFKEGFIQERILSHQFFVGKKKIKKLVQKEHAKSQKKAKDEGLTIQVGHIQNFSFLDQVRSWNQSRGYQIGFEDARIINQVSEFPDRYFLITFVKDKRAIAHSLCNTVLPGSLYYFLSAIDPKSTLKNVGDLILFTLFQLAAELKVSFIDLGSSENEVGVNHNLMFFKSRFSNEISNKISWTLKL